MLVSDFLEQRLKDNSSYVAGLKIEMTGDYHCPLQGGNGKNSLRTATKFLGRVEAHVNKALKACDDLVVYFGQEFELSGDQVFIRLKGDFGDCLNLETGNIIGFIRGRQGRFLFSVRVTSRFGDSFLRHMIATSEGFLELEDLGAFPDAGMNEWLLIYLWKMRLKRAFAAGIPKVYVKRAGQLPMIRGNLDVNAYLRVPADIGRYPCWYREHAFDNPVTRLIHTTFEMVSKWTNLSRMLTDVHDIRNAFAEACGGNILRPTEFQTQPVRNPYFVAYDEVAALSRMILAHQSADLGLDEEQFSGFLFDVSLLFEHYIRKLLIDERLQLAPKIAEDTISYPTGGRGRRGGRRKLVPDIVLHGPRGTLILDVKYKRWDRNGGVSRNDAFQIMTYASAYRKCYEKDKPVFGYGFVFPIEGSTQEQELIADEFCEFGMHFYVFFLSVPSKCSVDATNISTFEGMMRNNEIDFVEKIKKVIDTP